ncbi:MAG: hypothetical protein NT120_01990 [Candidatus Aenigmarchaeota archaeon]|nr:hypothetical protein [Candidatus Aenigmarchaeota archaeon]
MIGIMGSRWDFEIFLENGDIKKLGKKRIEGHVLRTINRKKYPLFLYVDDSNKYALGLGAGLTSENDTYEFVIHSWCQNAVEEKGWVELRYHGGLSGSTLEIIDVKTLGSLDKANYSDLQRNLGIC